MNVLESCENTRHDLRSQDCVANFMTISKICSNLSIIDTRLRLWMVDFLAAILYPKISVWEVLLRPSRSFSSHAQSQCVLKIICAIVSETDYCWHFILTRNEKSVIFVMLLEWRRCSHLRRVDNRQSIKNYSQLYRSSWCHVIYPKIKYL